MKTATVTYSPNVGGVETFIRLLADYFIEQGHDIAIIETHREGHWSKSFSASGHRVMQILSKFYYLRLRLAKDIVRELSQFDVVIDAVAFEIVSSGLKTDRTSGVEWKGVLSPDILLWRESALELDS